MSVFFLPNIFCVHVRNEVPNEWKHSVVCPIFKGGRKDRRVPTNYRPISLTSSVARLMEKIINVQVLDYLQSHSLLYKHQSGFLPTHSTVTQLIYLSNKWQMALEKGNHVQTAFLDLSKAYDRVSIPGLLFKLSALGFSTESLKWFSSFLQDRTQCVRVNGSLSSVEYLKSGIPQGTVLGPVLFLIFINDLPSVVENESSIFADDTTMFTFGEDLAYSCRSLTLDLNAASHWAKVWGMLYNAEKSQHLTVRSKHVRVSSPSISMGGVTVPQVDHHKHLGIHFNKSLTWTDHVNEVFSIVCSENRHATTPAKDTAKHCYSKNLHWLYSTHPRIRVSCLVWRSDRKAGEVARIVLPPPSCYASACEKTIWLPYAHLILQD